MSQSFTQSLPIPLPVSKGGTGVVTSTGTGSTVLSNSPTFDDSIAFGDTTKGIIGTATNNNADTGYVGEFVSSVIPNASRISFLTTDSADVTSISLTAGDWDVWGNVTFVTSGSFQQAWAWVSTTSAVLPDPSLYNGLQIVTATSGSIGIQCPQRRFSLSATTIVYLSVNATFTGTGYACGGIYARRVR